MATAPSKAVLDVAKDVFALAKTNNTLKTRLIAIVGESVFNQPSAEHDLSKMPLSTLEQVRDALDLDARRHYIAREVHNFFNPTADNENNGTIYYANKIKFITETSNNNDVAAVQFQNDHREFCKIFCANANASVFTLANALNNAYQQIRDAKTKQIVKPVLEQVGQRNKISLGLVVNRRIKRNAQD
jgi:hypothetical protein